jgi:hypothetical protein
MNAPFVHGIDEVTPIDTNWKAKFQQGFAARTENVSTAYADMLLGFSNWWHNQGGKKYTRRSAIGITVLLTAGFLSYSYHSAITTSAQQSASGYMDDAFVIVNDGLIAIKRYLNKITAGLNEVRVEVSNQSVAIKKLQDRIGTFENGTTARFKALESTVQELKREPDLTPLKRLEDKVSALEQNNRELVATNTSAQSQLATLATQLKSLGRQLVAQVTLTPAMAHEATVPRVSTHKLERVASARVGGDPRCTSPAEVYVYQIGRCLFL